MTRHGAGPLVSFDSQLTALIQETHNSAGSDWLGEFRNGHYDLVAMRYALKVCGHFDGLMISYLDILQKFTSWQICEGYTYKGVATDLDDYFELTGDTITAIKFRTDSGDSDYLQAQTRLTQLLKDCQPILTTLTATSDTTLEQIFLDYIEAKLQLPVVAIARGPKAADREIRSGWEHLFATN
jgi:adenylosuccinate synthase